MNKKRVRKNYYKNSRAKSKARTKNRFILGAKIFCVFVLLGGTSLLCLLAHDALVHSAYFEAQEIAIEGNSRLSKQVILKQGHIGVGDNILGVNLKTLRNHLLSNPWVAAVDVKRDLPDTIRIQIKENLPIAIVDLGRPFLLNDSGKVFKAFEPTDDVRVPVVFGLEPSDVQPNRPEPSRSLKAVLDVLQIARSNGSVLSSEFFQSIHVDKEMGLTLHGMDNGMAIKIGFGEYDLKFNCLKEMVAYLKREEQLVHVGLLDLNDMDRVVVRPVKTESLLQACYRKEM